MSEFKKILPILETAGALGKRQVPNGAVLIGHVPHVAPEAWLHEMFPPLSAASISELSQQIGQPVHADFCEFLQHSNGLMTFSCALAIYGKRSGYSRRPDDREPFCIVSPNTLERPDHAQDGVVVIGSYRQDGSLLLLDSADGSVFRTKARSKKVLNRWPGFWDMLYQEAQRLATLFDANGRQFPNVKTAPTPS